MQDQTIKYYNQNAKKFFADTRSIPLHENQDEFLSYLKPHAKILDLGCGSGRDTKYFLSKNYHVDAMDGSKELVKLAKNYTGTKVECALFSELSVIQEYEGIWACSSILHLPKEQLEETFKRIAEALKPSGYAYASFKYGDFEGERNQRYFIDFTEPKFRDFIMKVPQLKIIDIWTNCDLRSNRQNEKWLNIILQKNIHS